MKNKIQLVFISLICTCIVFLSALDSKFYGFEYEDSFINSYIASQNNYFDFIKNFRTEACNKFKNGKCVETSSYTGHYFLGVPWALLKRGPLSIHVGNPPGTPKG